MVNFIANIQNQHTEQSERGRRMREERGKHTANKSPYLRNGARYDHGYKLTDRLIGTRKSHNMHSLSIGTKIIDHG